ncbi:hypothetical protein [Spiroplasma sp. ChiS]|uniref:hypothetical protein n=1 Tax=Spiroplasma sp. ChiS TaxID=2099885 RepID=UPI001F3E117D|nr:hypothetical protein [Spiroplasma sp. ChiS]
MRKNKYTFFINDKYDFINKLTTIFSVFPPSYNDFKYKLNLKELNSFAYLIWENFSYYYNSSLRLKNNESIRITSYIGYEDGYWQRDYFKSYNEIVDSNNDIVEWKKINGRKIQNSQVKIIAKIHDEFGKKRQTTENPDMTTPSTSGMTQSNLNEELPKLLTIAVNKALATESKPSTSGTSSVLNKIDNYLDEKGAQQDKNSNEFEESILPSIISEIDKYLESPEGEWALLKNEIEKNFNRRERIEAGLKNEINNYFHNRQSVSTSLRDTINQYFSSKEIANKSLWKKMYKNMKKPFKTIKELISRVSQEYEPMSCSQEYFCQHEDIEIEDDITPLLPVRDNFILKFIILAIISDILGTRTLKDLNLL